MKITFKKIEIHNFMAFADEVFDFDKHKGMNLICGKNNDIPGSKNGCGKTLLCEALCFVLYGQTRNNIKNSNIWNKFIGSREMRLVLSFSVGKDEYKVASGFNKNGSPYCNLTLIVDGVEEDITKSSILETRKFLQNEILHCDMSIFLRTVILSSDLTYNFFRLRKAEKKEFIEKLFDISVFGNMYVSIHHDVLQLDKQISSLQNKLLVLTNLLESNTARAKKHDEDKKLKIKKYTLLLGQLKKQKDELSKSQIQYSEDEAKKYKDALSKLDEYSSKIDNKKQQLDLEKCKLSSMQTEIASSNSKLEKSISKHKDLLDKLCDDCKPIFISYYSIQEYKDKIEENNIKKAELDKKLSYISESMKVLQEQKSKILEKYDLATQKLNDLVGKYNLMTKKITDVQHQIDIVNMQLDTVTNESNPYNDLVESCNIEIQTENKNLDELAERYKYLKYAENIVSLDTIRKFIISDLVGVLNNKIKTYLTLIGSDYEATFDSDMNYKLIAKSSKTEYEYDNFSAGERARLMIASCFAFRDFMAIRNNLSCNILIVDEFIDGAIDSLAIDQTLKIMENFKEAYKLNIYIISHRKDIDNDLFDNIIQIVKTDHISRITYLEL